MQRNVIEVQDLTVDYWGRHGPTRAVDGISFSLAPGRILGIVGESGSGKSTVGYALMGLNQNSGATIGGRIMFEGTNVNSLTERQWRALRGDRMAMVFQDAMSTLNPVMRIGAQIAEVFRWHRPRMSRKEIRARTLDLLVQVGIAEPDRRIDSFPHELSGGMRQRVVIAAALALEPALLIADEPTTALDVTVQAQILKLMQNLIAEREMALILISHDLDVVGDVCEEIAVMKNGKIVEAGQTEAILQAPAHSYTRHLLAARPKFGAGQMRIQAQGAAQ